MVKIGTVDPLSLLERKDKWFLGGGKGAIYAPPFPRWLESPGFWDESYFADIRLTRLFTVLFCDFGGRPIRFRGEMVSWRPDRMIVEHRSAVHFIQETRVLTEQHEWVSVFELLEGEPIHAFVWSLPELKEAGYGTPWQSLTNCEVGENGISFDFATSWPGELEPDRTGIDAEQIAREAVAEMLPPLTLRVSLSANLRRLSHTVNLAQRHDDPPLWETSLLPQKVRDGRLPGDFKLLVGPPPIEGLVHILQQYELQAGEPLVVTAAVSIGNKSGQFEPKGTEVISESEGAWKAYFTSVPQFSSSDPFLTNAYWYRWYGLRLNTVDIPELPITRSIGFSDSQPPGVQGQDGPGTHRLEADVTFSPFVTEGVGFFRNFVTYSAQAHLREVAWMHSPRLALGILENLAKCQRPDGSFPGHNYTCRPARDFYHADYGTGSRLLGEIHPSVIPLQVVESLKRYRRYMKDERSSGYLHLVFDQNETGQEYMSRYSFVSNNADNWANFVVAGVDATSYVMELDVFLEKYDPNPPLFETSTSVWRNSIYERGLAMYYYMFDDESKFYCDSLPNQKNDYDSDDVWLRPVKSSLRPAAGLYPAMFFYGEETRQAVIRWLLNPSEFWLPKGFPATALSDSTFNQDAEWKDKRLNCPWNGRSWPMVNSHLVDAVANVARTAGPMQGVGNLKTESQVQSEELSGSSEPESQQDSFDLRLKAGEALMKAITLMFHDGNSARPNSYEHYDPITGTPSLYRGYDDYMHSWIIDLIMRHAVGVIPGEDHTDPFPLGVDWIECTDIPHPRGRMHVRIERDEVVRCEVIDKP